MDGLSIIGGMLSDCVPKVKEKALNALNNLSMNTKNQEEIQVSFLKGKIKVTETQEVVQGFQHVCQIQARMPKCFDVGHTSQQIWMICASQGQKDNLKMCCITGTYFL